jgi:hypothetical protein
VYTCTPSDLSTGISNLLQPAEAEVVLGQLWLAYREGRKSFVHILYIPWCPDSSGCSLAATPDCETAVLGLNPAVSPAYSGLPILRRAAIWDGTLRRLSSEGRQRRK